MDKTMVARKIIKGHNMGWSGVIYGLVEGENRQQAGFAEPHSILTLGWAGVGLGLGLGWGWG